jgi:hypothetical protein
MSRKRAYWMIGRAAQKTSGAPNRATEEYRNRGGAEQRLLSLGVNNRSYFLGSIGVKAAENISAAFAVSCLVPAKNQPRRNEEHEGFFDLSSRSSFLHG